MSKRRVVVTGMGIVSPVGNDLATAWDNIANGRSGIGRLTHFDPSAFTTHIAGEVRDFDPTRWINPKDAKKMDPFIHYGVAAAFQAMDDAGLAVTEANAERIGVMIGSGIGGILGIEQQTEKYLQGGPRKISPFYVPSTIINMLPGQISIMKGLKGPNFSAVSACATANHSIGMAMRMIQYGDADVMVAGGAERGSSPTSVGGFCAMKALSTRNDDPQAASRPWDAGRDGFVLGDGAGVLVLEEYETARARGAHLLRAGRLRRQLRRLAHDRAQRGRRRPGALHARGLRRRRRQCRGGRLPQRPRHLHAAGRRRRDPGPEARARRPRPPHHGQLDEVDDRPPAGAAGGVEAIFTIKALETGIIPPTINLDEPGEGCDLDYVPNVAREKRVDVAVSNGFGFGGTNGTLVFRRL